MTAADIPFESPQEIRDKLIRYEELFKDRYTENDEWYSKTLQLGPRCGSVCVCV